jgi:phage shock protein C
MSEHRRLYRSRRGSIFGVCRGIAEYFGMSVFWTRFFAVLLLLFTGLWPTLFVYVALGFLLPLEPVEPIRSTSEQEFYDSYANSRRNALHRLKRTFDHLDRRISRMEDHVTASEYDWERRMREQH